MRSEQPFREDERAIEGLPIRLVIAIVVGVAALSVMMTIIDDAGGVGQSELSAESDVALFTDNSSGQSVTITVTDDAGEPIPGATVLLESGTATLEDGPLRVGTTNETGNATATIPGDSVDWRSDQDTGTLSVEIIPPGDADFKDDMANAEIVVVES